MSFMCLGIRNIFHKTNPLDFLTELRIAMIFQGKLRVRSIPKFFNYFYVHQFG